MDEEHTQLLNEMARSKHENLQMEIEERMSQCPEPGTRLEFLRAASQGDLKSIREILDIGTPVDLSADHPLNPDFSHPSDEPAPEFFDNSRTPLMEAAFKGQAEAAQLLLDRGADIDEVTAPDTKPLRHAVIGGQVETARLLYKFGSDVHELAQGDQTLLHSAVSVSSWTPGHAEIVDWLLDQGLDINALDYYKRSVLAEAVRCSTFDAVNHLIKRGANVNVPCSAPPGIYHGPTTVAALAKSSTPLACAAARGNSSILLLLLQSGATLNDEATGRCMAVEEAAGAGHNEVVSMLLDELGACPAPDHKANSLALHRAGVGGYAKVSQILIDHGFDINAKDHRGLTPLMAAAGRAQPEITQLLVDAGADFECTIAASQWRGMTALHFSGGFPELLEFNDTNIEGYLECAKILANAGANLDARDSRGRTAKDIAIIFLGDNEKVRNAFSKP